MTDDLSFLTISQAAGLMERGELSPLELTEAKLRRIEAIDPQLNAFITLTAERALEQAAEAEREISGRPSSRLPPVISAVFPATLNRSAMHVS